MKEKFIKKIDYLIKDHKIRFPNIWHCYGACKEVVFKGQRKGEITYSCQEYDEYVDYITNKLFYKGRRKQ